MRRLAPLLLLLAACRPEPDDPVGPPASRDTGEPRPDTGETGETGVSVETGETGVPVETGETDTGGTVETGVSFETGVSVETGGSVDTSDDSGAWVDIDTETGTVDTGSADTDTGASGGADTGASADTETGASADTADTVDTADTAPVSWLGPHDVTTEADVTFTGETTTDNAGWSTALEDLDGDGLDDLLIAAPLSNSGAGTIWTFYGAPTSTSLTSADADATLALSAWGGLGYALAFPGDLDGDGIGDIAAGAPWKSDGVGWVGAVYLFPAGATGTVTEADALATLWGTGHDDDAGLGVAAPGDLDGDGVADLLTCARDADASVGASAGLVYAALGPFAGSELLADAELILEGEAASDHAGTTVGAADTDGDGLSEMLTVAPYTGNGVGYVVAWPGAGTVSLAAADARIEATSGWGAFSVAAGVGDIDGDGYGDVLFGAPNDDTVAHLAGAAYVFHGPVSGTYSASDADIIVAGTAAGDTVGGGTVGPADLDADGVADLLVSTDDGVGIWFGPLAASEDLTTVDAMLEGSGLDAYGKAAGDVDGDGVLDLLLGTPRGHARYGSLSSAYLLYGRY